MIELAAHAGHRSMPIETSFLRECIDCEETYDPTRSLSGVVEQYERAAVVKALNNAADTLFVNGDRSLMQNYAEKIENGADW